MVWDVLESGGPVSGIIIAEACSANFRRNLEDDPPLNWRSLMVETSLRLRALQVGKQKYEINYFGKRHLQVY